MRRAVAPSCCHGRVASTSAAASAAVRPSPSCSTPSAGARTAATTSARPAGSTTSWKKPGSAPSARRAGKVSGSSWECKDFETVVCVCVCDVYGGSVKDVKLTVKGYLDLTLLLESWI